MGKAQPGMLAARWLLAGVLTLITAGCASGGVAGRGSGSAELEAVESAAAATLTVAAASSLTDVFATIVEEFSAATGVPVRTTYAGSSTLAEQIRAGAPIDVFAAAGPTVMTPLAQEQLVTDLRDFATNSLMIAVPTGNPGSVRGLADLTGVSVVVCAEQVPCGTSARQLLANNDLDVQPASYERDARAVLMKIRTDEADAGLVYVTDVAAAADEVEGVEIPVEANVSTTYQVAVVADSPVPDEAAQFVEFVNTPAAQAALASARFGPPP